MPDPKSLSKSEQAELGECEGIVELGLHSFVDLGN